MSGSDDELSAATEFVATGGTPTYVRSIVRAVAVVLLGYSGVILINVVIYLFVPTQLRRIWEPHRWDTRADYYFEIWNFASGAALGLLLWVCGCGVLTSQSWSRRGVMMWAILSMLVSIVNAIPGYVAFVRGDYFMSALIEQPIWQTTWYLIANGLHSSAFPLIVLIVFARREVVALLAEPADRGFAVITLDAPSDDDLGRTKRR